MSAVYVCLSAEAAAKIAPGVEYLLNPKAGAKAYSRAVEAGLTRRRAE